MKRLLLLGGIVGATSAAWWAPVEPAGACSIYCPPGELQLELVEVVLVEAAPDQEAPELPEAPETGTIDEWGSAWFDDNSFLYWSQEWRTVEVSR